MGNDKKLFEIDDTDQTTSSGASVPLGLGIGQTAPPPNQDGGKRSFEISDEPMDLSWQKVGQQALVNFPSSAVDVGKSMVYPITHFKETAEGLGQLGKGLYSKAEGAFRTQDPEQKAMDEAAANSVGEYFANRYGSMAGFKQALAKDPAGVMSDISVPLTLGGGAAARAPGIIGKVGELTKAVGSAIDPFNIALKGGAATTEAIGKGVIAPYASLKSGATVKSLQTAVDAGQELNPTFLKHFSGQGSPAEMVDAYAKAISDAREAVNAEYRTGMQGIKANQAPLPFIGIDKTFNNQLNSIQSLGKTYRENSLSALGEVRNAIDQWKNQPNAPGANSLHDMDALKQRISEIRDKYKSDASAERVITAVRRSVYDTIANRDPKYANIMESYANGLDQIKDIRQTIGDSRDISTAKKVRNLLKAQKTQAGNEALERLDKYNPELKYMLAGSELSELFPYGGLRQVVGPAEAANALHQYANLGNPLLAAVQVASIPFSSPAISGGVIGTLGAVSGASKKGAQLSNKYLPTMARMPAYGVGRISEEAGPDEVDLPPVQQRAIRASGGRISTSSLGDKLVLAAERAKKENSKATEPLLNVNDESIAKALEIANRNL